MDCRSCGLHSHAYAYAVMDREKRAGWRKKRKRLFCYFAFLINRNTVWEREPRKNFPRKLDKVLIGCYLTLTEDTGEACAHELSTTMEERAAWCVHHRARLDNKTSLLCHHLHIKEGWNGEKHGLTAGVSYSFPSALPSIRVRDWFSFSLPLSSVCQQANAVVNTSSKIFWRISCLFSLKKGALKCDQYKLQIVGFNEPLCVLTSDP